MNTTPYDLTIQPGPHFGGQLPPLEWRNGFPYIAPPASEAYSLCPDGAPDRFCILTKPANGLVATCLIMAGEKTCDTTTGRAGTDIPKQVAPLTANGECIALRWSLGEVMLQATVGVLGLAVLVVGVAAKGGYEYVLRPLTRAAWAYLTRPPKRELPDLRKVRMPEGGQGVGGGNRVPHNVFYGGYHVHNHYH